MPSAESVGTPSARRDGVPTTAHAEPVAGHDGGPSIARAGTASVVSAGCSLPALRRLLPWACLL